MYDLGLSMGIFNMMFVIPRLRLAATLPFIYQPLLKGDPRNVLSLCGVLMFAAAAAVWSVRSRNAQGLPLGATP